MPFPPDVPTVRVTYTAASPAGGQPGRGTVEFAPVAQAITLPEHGIVYSGRGVYNLDEEGRLVDTDGTLGVPLLACDIPGANPAEWVWQVVVSLDNAGPRRFYLALSIAQTTVDLRTVTEVDPSRAHYVMVPGPRGEQGEQGPRGPEGPPATGAETPDGALAKIAAHAQATDPHGDRVWASGEFYPLTQGSALASRVTALESAAETAPHIAGSRSDGTALANLLTALASAGIVFDDTTE
ncbi:hypothetical protein [Streptomyces hydrogenans]|uniref:hypothetical protein n=1 Tax=Streptomyces hydrogenans TaxID=1873719 RepID=UPI0036EECFBB